MDFSMDVSMKWVVSLLILTIGGHPTFANDISINLSGDGCDNLSGYYIGDDDIASVFHRVSFSVPKRDDCVVTLRTDPGRRLEYIIEDAMFQQCGITISLFDSPDLNVNARHILHCERGNNIPIQSMTNYNVLRLHVRKPNVDTDNFRFAMRVITDRGGTRTK